MSVACAAAFLLPALNLTCTGQQRLHVPVRTQEGSDSLN